MQRREELGGAGWAEELEVRCIEVERAHGGGAVLSVEMHRINEFVYFSDWFFYGFGASFLKSLKQECRLGRSQKRLIINGGN